MLKDIVNKNLNRESKQKNYSENTIRKSPSSSIRCGLKTDEISGKNREIDDNNRFIDLIFWFCTYRDKIPIDRKKRQHLQLLREIHEALVGLYMTETVELNCSILNKNLKLKLASFHQIPILTNYNLSLSCVLRRWCGQSQFYFLNIFDISSGLQRQNCKSDCWSEKMLRNIIEKPTDVLKYFRNGYPNCELCDRACDLRLGG